MAGDDDVPSSEPGHLRRRSTSSRHAEDDDDDYVPVGREEASSPQRQAIDVAGGSRPASPADAIAASGTDSKPRHSTNVDSQDVTSPRTVRFSADVHRELPTQRSRSIAEARLHTSSASASVPAPINTDAARRASVGHFRPTQSDPLSPNARNRGYSLRRALFQRNMVDGTDISVIELQQTGSSSSDSTNASPRTRTSSNTKKSGDATITVSPVDLSDLTFDEPRAPDKKGGLGSLPNYEEWLEHQQGNRYVRYFKPRLEALRKKILRVQDIPPSKDGRHIPLQLYSDTPLVDERTNAPYTTNWIRSTRYSAWDFVPRQLLAQFRKLANFYFLAISILQMIPGLSTTGTYTTIIPLMFFVAISIGKEGWDDWRRHKMDVVENNRIAMVLRVGKEADFVQAGSPPRKPLDSHNFGALGNALFARFGLRDDGEKVPMKIEPVEGQSSLHWVSTKWQDLRVGDVVKLMRDDPVPADLVLLQSSGENNIAYVETMALDGETNLKSKQTPSTIAPVCLDEASIAACHATFVAEDPNVDLYKFEGRVSIGQTTSPLTNNEVLYRNSVLRNTPSMIGFVIYSGEECKIRMNANKNPRIKAPRLQSVVNKIVIMMVFFVVALSLFNTIAYQVWKKNLRKMYFLDNAQVPFYQILISFIVMFNTLIPLSLYVSMEIIKVIQLLLMNWDVDMYDAKSDTPFRAQTSTINEELGQISYVFSDKTGTLTDNEMKFRKISVAGTAWLHDYDLKEEKKGLVHKKRKAKKDKGKKRKSFARDRRQSALEHGPAALAEAHDTDNEEPNWQASARPVTQRRELRTKDMIRYIQHRPNTAFARKATMFLLSIALCHTCLPETREDGTVDFQAASPDELALVRAAQELGFMVIDRNLNTITIRHQPTSDEEDVVEEMFDILDVIEFSSKRKRMSVLVRFPNRKICVITKGADSVIMQRMKLSALASRKAAEIEERVNKRRSMEASLAMARKSSVQIVPDGRQSSIVGRPSMSRPSLSRKSTGQRFQPVRDEVDQWLKDRENDVHVSSIDGAEEDAYTPRPSATLNRLSMGAATPRPSGMSLAMSETPSSVAWDEDEEEELVEEAMVRDEAKVVERCLQHINDFATEGLRTLLYGYRFISDEEYAGWKKIYLDASTSLEDRERKIERAGELIELDLDLAGATAIEDKLQVGVPEAIDKLRRANIKMWMLTGDKRETAINIGHSCRLIKDYSSVTILDQEIGEVDRAIGNALVALAQGHSVAHSVVVVDGQTLSYIEQSHALTELFYQLAIVTDSVICCRASPSQKAKLVKEIRNRVHHAITLAIGDGANDIAMIQTAHVGIGITGKEGLQAARTSDYAIAQFRFLTKLLLVHGRWNYIRTCKYILGTFWKELLFYLTQALYQRWNGYTGTSLYEPWSLSMFNTLFTSLPVICMGAFEKDLQASTLLAVPELYTKGQRDGAFNFRLFFGWMFMASSDAMVIFFVVLSFWGHAVFLTDDSLFPLGQMCFTACVIVIQLKIQLVEMHNKSILAFGSMTISIGGWFLWNILLGLIYNKSNKIYRVRHALFETFGKSGLWWFTLILAVLSTVVFEYMVSSLRAAWFPTDADVFQALEQDLPTRKRFEEASAMELQGGWEQRGLKKKTSLELREEEAERIRKEVEQEKREEEVRQILRSRPDGPISPVAKMQSERMSTQDVMDEVGRTSVDVGEMLSQRFGNVKRA